MHAIRIDRSKPLSAQPHCGHNRYHPDIAPALEVGEGEEVVLETRDAIDGQLKPPSTVADFAKIDTELIHPLTGPVYIKGVKAGDVLEIEFLDIVPQQTGFSCILPGLGFLRDVMAEPFLVHWTLRDGWATSEQIPGVRIPGAPFMGISAVAMDRARTALVRTWRHRNDAGPCRGHSYRSVRTQRPSNAAAAGERRQLRRQATHPRLEVVPAGVRRWRPVFYR